MKTLFRTALLLVCGFPLFACTPHAASDAPYRIEEGTIVFAEPARAEGQCDVLQLRCDPIPVVRVAFIGLGMRGSTAVERFTQLDGVEIVALCDKVPAHVERAQRTLSVHGLPAAQEFTGADDWRRVCELEGVDLIYNCTDWQMHVPIALYAMERGKHVAVEVPAALTVADCWALVDAAERTRRHCMMLENCCYDFFEMTTLNMAREVGGHGGMDFIMDYRLVYCLRHGLPLDQDVYDAAEWSSLAELTEASVRNGSMPVAMPDFTRGAWRKVEGFSHAMAE